MDEKTVVYEVPAIIEEGVLEIRAGSQIAGSFGYPEEPLGLDL